MQHLASSSGTDGSRATSPRPPHVRRSRRWPAVVVGCAVVALAGCGDDPDDAPGGSAPPSVTSPSGEGGATGSRPVTSGPSAESADEGHPSIPKASVATTDGG